MSSACLSILAWLKIEGADQSNHSRWHLVGMVDSSHNLKKRTWISAVPFISPLDPFWLRSRVKSSWRLNSPSWPLKWVTERIRDGRPRPWQSIEYLDILGILGDLWVVVRNVMSEEWYFKSFLHHLLSGFVWQVQACCFHKSCKWKHESLEARSVDQISERERVEWG